MAATDVTNLLIAMFLKNYNFNSTKMFLTVYNHSRNSISVNANFLFLFLFLNELQLCLQSCTTEEGQVVRN